MGGVIFKRIKGQGAKVIFAFFSPPSSSLLAAPNKTWSGGWNMPKCLFESLEMGRPNGLQRRASSPSPSVLSTTKAAGPRLCSARSSFLPSFAGLSRFSAENLCIAVAARVSVSCSSKSHFLSVRLFCSPMLSMGDSALIFSS